MVNLVRKGVGSNPTLVNFGGRREVYFVCLSFFRAACRFLKNCVQHVQGGWFMEKTILPEAHGLTGMRVNARGRPVEASVYSGIQMIYKMKGTESCAWPKGHLSRTQVVIERSTMV